MTDPVVRSATADDVEAILDLLTDYGQPRSNFEPCYYRDPTYRPWHSFVLEHHGKLLSHVRLFTRSMRLDGELLPIAGIGNVITAVGARGHGYSHRVLDAALQAAETACYAYSFLWTHLPALYVEHGFSTVEEAEFRVRIEAAGGNYGIRAAGNNDLPLLLRADQQFNADRTGPIQMSRSLWCATHHCTRARTLVSIPISGGTDHADYLRYRAQDNHIEVLDLGVEPDNAVLAHALLTAAVADHPGVPLRLTLPPSLQPVLDPWPSQYRRVAELMGKPLSLEALAAVLAGLLPRRLRASGRDRAVLGTSTGTNDAVLHITRDGLTVSRGGTGAADRINSAALTRLLLHGATEIPALEADNDADPALLAALFPVQDFVIWPAGRF